MSKNKIALIQASICEIDGKSELRYTIWEEKLKEEKSPHDLIKTRAVLIYENMELQDVINGIKIELNVRRFPITSWQQHEEEDRLFISPGVSDINFLSKKIEIRPIGQYEDLDCYVILNPNKDSHATLSIVEMPPYGRPSVVYRPNTVRESMGEVNITGVTHDGDVDFEKRLFDFIDDKVQAIYEYIYVIKDVS